MSPKPPWALRQLDLQVDMVERAAAADDQNPRPCCRRGLGQRQGADQMAGAGEVAAEEGYL